MPTNVPKQARILVMDVDHNLIAHSTVFAGNARRFYEDFPDLTPEQYTHCRKIDNAAHPELNDFIAIFPEANKKIITAALEDGVYVVLMTSAEYEKDFLFPSLADLYAIPQAVFFEKVLLVNRYDFGGALISKGVKTRRMQEDGLLPQDAKAVMVDDDCRYAASCEPYGFTFIQARGCITVDLMGRTLATRNTYLQDIIDVLQLPVTLTPADIEMCILPPELDVLSPLHAMFLESQDLKIKLSDMAVLELEKIAARWRNKSDAEKLYYLKPHIGNQNFLLTNVATIMYFVTILGVKLKDCLAYILSKITDSLWIEKICKDMITWSLRAIVRESFNASNNIFIAIQQTPDFYALVNTCRFMHSILNEIQDDASMVNALAHCGLLNDNPEFILFFIQRCHDKLSTDIAAQLQIKIALQRIIEQDHVVDTSQQRITTIVKFLESACADSQLELQHVAFYTDLLQYIVACQNRCASMEQHGEVNVAHASTTQFVSRSTIGL